jgi:hypothetical protein
VNKANLDNLTKGAKPSLHPADPDWDTLVALVERAGESLDDARNDTNSLATRFAAAYGASFWLARVALEACGYRLAGADGHRTIRFQSLGSTLDWEPLRWRRLDDFHRFRNRFEYGDVVEVSEQQVLAAVDAAQELLYDVVRAFPRIKP